MTSENTPTLNEPREKITAGIKGGGTRHTADSINDDDLDQLYADLAHAQAEAARWAEAESADVAAGSYAGRVEELQTVIARVAALRDDLRGITGARWIADMLDKILDEQPGPAATEATQPADWLYAGTRDLSIPAQQRYTVRPVDPAEEQAASDRARRIVTEAQRVSPQLAAPYTGLVIEPYRDDHNRPAWVFRCWGTDTCDGYLSLDHYSQQSAERARDRHLAEDHPTEEQPGA